MARIIRSLQSIRNQLRLLCALFCPNHHLPQVIEQTVNLLLIQYCETIYYTEFNILYFIFLSTWTGGLIWIAEWNALQHPVAVAFLASLYGDYMEKSDNENLECDEKTFKSEDLREFAKKQVSCKLINYNTKLGYQFCILSNVTPMYQLGWLRIGRQPQFHELSCWVFKKIPKICAPQRSFDPSWCNHWVQRRVPVARINQAEPKWSNGSTCGRTFYEWNVHWQSKQQHARRTNNI